MPYPSDKYPFCLGVRLKRDEHAKLTVLAKALGLTRAQALRYLVERVEEAEVRVAFKEGTREAVGVGSRAEDA
jgi:hypothetical protein